MYVSEPLFLALQAAKDEDDAGTRLAELSKTLSRSHKDTAAKEKAVAAASKASLKADTSVEDLKMRIVSDSGGGEEELFISRPESH